MKTVKHRALLKQKLKTLEIDLCASNASWADSFFIEILPDHEDLATVFAAECSFHAGTRLAIEALTKGGFTASYRKLYHELFEKAKKDWAEMSTD